jgi:Tfp pilus assembly protein PilF
VLRAQGDNEGAAREAVAGQAISKERTAQQAATFNTNSGIRMLNAGDLNGAIDQFRSAIKSSPTYAPAHFQLAIALERKGEKDEAKAEFDRAAQLDPTLKRPGS